MQELNVPLSYNDLCGLSNHKVVNVLVNIPGLGIVNLAIRRQDAPPIRGGKDASCPD